MVMSLNIIYILGAFAVSLASGLTLIPLVVRFCKRRKLYDVPNERKVHKSGVPRLGGICFVPCMLLAFALALLVFNGQAAAKGGQITVSLWSFYFFISLVTIYGVGLIDDLVELPPGVKFVVQIAAASLLPLAGLYINNLYGFLGFHELPAWVGMPLTVFIIVFIDNAMNLIDGIDGLSAGLAIIALAGFLFCFLREGLWIYGILISGLMGVLVSFMYYNVFGRVGHKKIFMGDSGSLSIGFVLGFLLVKFSMDNPAVKPFREENILLACTMLIVPVFDVCRIIMVRFAHRRPIFGADKNHIHHKLLRAGLTQRQALVALLGVALLFIAVNMPLATLLGINWLVAIDVALWLAVQQVINRHIRKRGGCVYQRVEQGA